MPHCIGGYFGVTKEATIAGAAAGAATGAAKGAANAASRSKRLRFVHNPRAKPAAASNPAAAGTPAAAKPANPTPGLFERMRGVTPEDIAKARQNVTDDVGRVRQVTDLVTETIPGAIRSVRDSGGKLLDFFGRRAPPPPPPETMSNTTKALLGITGGAAAGGLGLMALKGMSGGSGGSDRY